MARRKIMIARLPATPCTPEMQAAVLAIAEAQGRSIADIQRDAITLFLRKSGTRNTKSDTVKSEVQS